MTEPEAAHADVRADVGDGVSKVAKIKQRAINALRAKDQNFPAFRVVGQLEKHRASCTRVEYLETKVLAFLAGRRRHRLVVRMLGELKAISAQNGNESAFERFHEFIAQLTNNMTITQHGYSTGVFSQMDHKPIWSLVSNHMKTLEDEGYQVFLNSGTLLGVVRDGRLIDHDDDIDLAVILKSRTIEDVAEEWATLKVRLENLGLASKNQVETNAIFKLEPKDGCTIDLFPCWINEKNRVFVFPYSHGEVMRRALLPLKTCTLTGQKIPKRPERFLALNYGAGWSKPDPFFLFPWQRQKKVFAEFLEAVA